MVASTGRMRSLTLPVLLLAAGVLLLCGTPTLQQQQQQEPEGTLIFAHVVRLGRRLGNFGGQLNDIPLF